MKERVSLSLRPEVLSRARKLARARETNLSAFVEELLESVALHDEEDFVTRWEGRFSVAERPGDARLEALKKKYGL